MACYLDHLILSSDSPEETARLFADSFAHQRRPSLEAGEFHLLSNHGFSLEIGRHAGVRGIASLAFSIDDLDSFSRHVKGAGLRVLTPEWQRPDGRREITFEDPHGLAFSLVEREEINSTGDGLRSATGMVEAKPTLAHVNVLVSDLAKQHAFYQDVLGLCTVSIYEAPDANFIYLTDTCCTMDHRSFLLEVTGPLGLEPREQRLLDSIGPCYDHLCYEIDDVDGAYRQLSSNGLQEYVAPYNAYGGKLAWLKPPALGFCEIELVRPISHDGFATAVATGRPTRRP